MKNKIGKGIIEYLLNVIVRVDNSQVELSDGTSQQNAILNWKDPEITEEIKRELTKTLKNIGKREKYSDEKESQTNQRESLEGKRAGIKSIMTATKKVERTEQVGKPRREVEQVSENKDNERNIG